MNLAPELEEIGHCRRAENREKENEVLEFHFSRALYLVNKTVFYVCFYRRNSQLPKDI